VSQPITPDPEPIVRRDPIATTPADPWAVEYGGGGHHVVPEEPSMVGYTAPFAAAPAEPIGLSQSAMSPDIEPAEERGDAAYEPLLHTEPEVAEETPLVMRTRSTEDQDLSRLSQDLDLQLDDTSESTSAELSLDPDEPVIEISARDVLPEHDSHAISIDDVPEHAWQSDRTPHIDEPASVATAPSTRRAKSGSSSSVLRLMPLAIWARAEMDKPGKPAPVDEETPRTVNDELRDLMSRLALPPNIAGVSYARGVRIRRVRVQGTGNVGDDGAPGPVILSKKALEQQRART
jgi:hypothetical protein